MIFKRLSLRFLFFSVLCSQPSWAAKPVKVYASIPELAWILENLAPPQAKVESLLALGVNAHYVDAKPSFIMKLREADLLCQVGFGLESAWLDRAIERSFNKNLTKGKKGYCAANAAISVLDRSPTPLDRSHGHMHAQGNPHFWYAPSKLAELVPYLKEKLSAHFAKEQSLVDEIANKANVLSNKLYAAENKWKTKFSKASSAKIIQYHSDFDYYVEALGLESVVSIESKPGVPPTVSHLAKVKKLSKKNNVKVILTMPWDPKESVDSVAKLISAKVVSWPTDESDYIESFETFSKSVLEAIK